MYLCATQDGFGHFVHIHHLVPQKQLLQQPPYAMIILLFRTASFKLYLNLFTFSFCFTFAVTTAVIWSINWNKSGYFGRPVCHLKAELWLLETGTILFTKPFLGIPE